MNSLIDPKQCASKYVALPASWRREAAAEAGSVLLETSRFDAENFSSYLFRRPVEALIVNALDEVPAFFQRIEQALAAGKHVAGYFSYELGFAFERRLRAGIRFLPEPLAWVGVYDEPLCFDHRSIAIEEENDAVPEGSPHCELSRIHMDISEPEYQARVEEIRRYIAAGDTYQVNFTSKMSFELSGSPLALYEKLRRSQKVAYAAYLNTGDKTILSFSPELFLRWQGSEVETRPMKGTMQRGRFPEEDARWRERLKTSEKDRAENVMIVDLLRNDLGRVCEIGSVQVDRLFDVERYETLYQMTSTISGGLRSDVSLHELFAATFPSGSVTGAPKTRTMQIIQELENSSRGVYTGAIGYLSPSKQAVFSVAIRTIELHGVKGEMGVGSGITFASEPASEYRECVLKTKFLTDPPGNFQLIESILWDGDYRLLEQHLNRLRSTAGYFSFPYDETVIRAALQENAASMKPDTNYKVRLLLNETGAISIENKSPMEVRGKVAIAAERVNSQDRFLFHKTTRREFYDRHWAEARQRGLDDYIFLNERGEVTEGAIHNVFVEADGNLYTPPVECGLLAGVCRSQVLADNPKAQEKVLHLDDLQNADAIYVCNAVRGLQKVILVEQS